MPSDFFLPPVNTLFGRWQVYDALGSEALPTNASRALPVPVQDPLKDHPEPLPTDNAARVAEMRAGGQEIRAWLDRSESSVMDFRMRLAQSHIGAEITRLSVFSVLGSNVLARSASAITTIIYSRN